MIKTKRLFFGFFTLVISDDWFEVKEQSDNNGEIDWFNEICEWFVRELAMSKDIAPEEIKEWPYDKTGDISSD